MLYSPVHVFSFLFSVISFSLRDITVSLPFPTRNTDRRFGATKLGNSSKAVDCRI